MTTYYIEDWDKWSSNPGYGRLNNRKASWAQQPVLLPSYLGFSDYSGSDVERSNVRVWKDQFSDSEGEVWVESYGGHGTTQIVVHPDRIVRAWRILAPRVRDGCDAGAQERLICG